MHIYLLPHDIFLGVQVSKETEEYSIRFLKILSGIN
jgi:hypothetical protein